MNKPFAYISTAARLKSSKNALGALKVMPSEIPKVWRHIVMNKGSAFGQWVVAGTP